MKKYDLSTYQHVIMIGMPGSGKSTIGKDLANQIGWQFVDADDLIASTTGKTLQEIIDKQGLDRFAEIEEKILCNLDFPHHVIATGGSAVYYEKAMTIFKKNSLLIYLDL